MTVNDIEFYLMCDGVDLSKVVVEETAELQFKITVNFINEETETMDGVLQNIAGQFSGEGYIKVINRVRVTTEVINEDSNSITVQVTLV